jgi:hypothetical protein
MSRGNPATKRGHRARCDLCGHAHDSYRGAPRGRGTARVAATMIDRKRLSRKSQCLTIVSTYRRVGIADDQQMKILLRKIPLRSVCATPRRQRRFLFVF